MSCHRDGNDKGNVRLDTKEAAFGGDDVIIAGNPEDSSLYWTTTLPTDDELFMPPIKNEEKDYPLTDAEKKILHDWIKEGAAWPDGVTLNPEKRLPKKVDFVEHVQPILELNCVACHYEGKVKGDLRLDSFEHAFVADHVIVPGEPLDSDLWVLCTLPMDDEMFMPPEGNDPLSSTDLFMLRRWIEEGADWPESAKLQPQKKSFTTLGMLPKDLYQELGFKEGKTQDEFTSYRQEIETSNLNFEMLPIQGGEFLMGSPASDEKRGDNELVSHKVKVSDFWMGKYEVTQAQFEEVMGTNPSSFSGVNMPVEMVTWSLAVEFCKELTKQERNMDQIPLGWTYHLPTEAQWEYACRAGTETSYSFGNKILPTDARWSDGKSPSQSSEVGRYPSNPWGFHDMHGNVWEWCSDWYGEYPSTVAIDPIGPTAGTKRVRRGGSWLNPAILLRSAWRFESAPSDVYSYVGFRACLSKR